MFFFYKRILKLLYLLKRHWNVWTILGSKRLIGFPFIEKEEFYSFACHKRWTLNNWFITLNISVESFIPVFFGAVPSLIICWSWSKITFRPFVVCWFFWMSEENVSREERTWSKTYRLILNNPLREQLGFLTKRLRRSKIPSLNFSSFEINGSCLGWLKRLIERNLIGWFFKCTFF